MNSLALNHPNVFVIAGIQGNGLAYFNLVQEKNLEGIVLKKADSPYEINKRSHNWLKMINYDYTEVLIYRLYQKGYKIPSILSRWNCSWIYGIHATCRTWQVSFYETSKV